MVSGLLIDGVLSGRRTGYDENYITTVSARLGVGDYGGLPGIRVAST